jgi:hypothetical protein
MPKRARTTPMASLRYRDAVGRLRRGRSAEASSQAEVRARRSVIFFTAASFTFVAPRSPHLPLQGRNAFGSLLTNICCSIGVNFTIPKIAPKEICEKPNKYGLF